MKHFFDQLLIFHIILLLFKLSIGILDTCRCFPYTSICYCFSLSTKQCVKDCECQNNCPTTPTPSTLASITTVVTTTSILTSIINLSNSMATIQDISTKLNIADQLSETSLVSSTETTVYDLLAPTTSYLYDHSILSITIQSLQTTSLTNQLNLENNVAIKNLLESNDQDITACLTNCSNNGVCQFDPQIDLCQNETCFTNGKCFIVDNKPKCKCFQYYSGEKCELQDQTLATIKYVANLALILAIIIIFSFYILILVSDLLKYVIFRSKYRRRKIFKKFKKLKYFN